VLKLDLENLAVQHRPRKAEARDDFDRRVAAMVRAIDLSTTMSCNGIASFRYCASTFPRQFSFAFDSCKP
jgi:hypothetical protein